jgi:spermidine/putrescine transport system ATP-binding protein/putrescine transport system ATP-binding protein
VIAHVGDLVDHALGDVCVTCGAGPVEALAYHGLDLQLHVRTTLADSPFLVRVTADTADRRTLGIGDAVEIGWAAADTRIFRN